MLHLLLLFKPQIAPYVTCLINSIYWAPNSPRILSRQDAQRLVIPDTSLSGHPRGSPGLPHRLVSLYAKSKLLYSGVLTKAPKP